MLLATVQWKNGYILAEARILKMFNDGVSSESYELRSIYLTPEATSDIAEHLKPYREPLNITQAVKEQRKKFRIP